MAESNKPSLFLVLLAVAVGKNVVLKAYPLEECGGWKSNGRKSGSSGFNLATGICWSI